MLEAVKRGEAGMDGGDLGSYGGLGGYAWRDENLVDDDGDILGILLLYCPVYAMRGHALS